MSDKKISELPDGGAVQSTDEFVAARAGANVKIAGSAIGGSGSVPFVGASAPSSPADGELWWDTDDDTAVAGASSPLTATATVTTDANTFKASHVFDFGDGPHLAQVDMTILALTPDGETFGEGSGNIQVLTDQDPKYQVSFDNSTFADRQVLATLEPAGITVGVVQFALLGVPRYLEVTVEIIDDSFATYSGPNHPTAQVRFDVTYT